ncbi:MAG: tRNA (adenosine(37)-N6)-threonylcarbamoyltransferase complex transferase subunit TsaD [Candidatus Pacebacteria bacterium]|nr:tRNA (adenosine(37)-N6)-threonylcarbamoyltransferase complex transferase subunit TsaD [Candidatus Paceibacterota bacterium]
MIILAIDTSCDDTSVAISSDNVVLANIIFSQVALHKEWGGVVPTIAKRAHQEHIDGVIQKAMKQAKMSLSSIEVFGVTQGPGLAIALEVGIAKAKELASTYNKPLVAVNHMEGHLYANFAATHSSQKKDIQFPALVLLVSGGHSDLFIMRDHGHYEKLGEKLDDAVGEAFDKVARMLGLGYPGGALLAKLAEKGDSSIYKFPVPLHQVKDFNFSYSGLKTAIQRVIKEKTANGTLLAQYEICDISASFQRVAIHHLIERVERALQIYEVKSLLLGGGVSANLLLRKHLRNIAKKYHVEFFYPKNKKLCMDNAAMIAVTAWYKAMRGEFVKDFDRNPGMSIESSH